MQNIQLVVLDMAGTTVRDNHEVEACFAAAARQTGLQASDDRILAVQGMAKRFVFQMLWTEQIGENHPELADKTETSYQVFKAILEDHYRTHEVVPTAGCLEVFAYLKAHTIKIALTTGFYRRVTNIILHHLGWDAGLDQNYKGAPAALIDVSIASDEVAEGRPSPLMIQKAMQTLGITEPQSVVNVGDTPSDLASGKNAHCAFSLGVTNGTHTPAQLQRYPHDGLLASLRDLPEFLETRAR